MGRATNFVEKKLPTISMLCCACAAILFFLLVMANLSSVVERLVIEIVPVRFVLMFLYAASIILLFASPFAITGKQLTSAGSAMAALALTVLSTFAAVIQE